MLIYLLRHGLTEYNAQKRYQGQRDIPLSPEGAAQLRKADFDPDVVYVTPLQRTSQTAKIVFPHAKLVVVDGLKEMCFGSFEGRNFIEMEHDPDYQAWVQANCESSCPDGERKEDFSNRICAAFSKHPHGAERRIAEKMLIYLLRHGLTEYNAQKRYQGQRDIPLSPEGAAQLRKADFDPDVVYVTPLQRTSQTAKIVFPHAKLVVVDGLKEMCFGSFEGRNFIEMEHDPDYQAWVQANCESSCPDGERKEDFSNRICAAFSKLVDEALAEGKDRLVILAHGGTQMAAMERYGVPHQDYYRWCGPNAGGYVLDAKDWTQKHILTVIKTVQYTKSAAEENP